MYTGSYSLRLSRSPFNSLHLPRGIFKQQPCGRTSIDEVSKGSAIRGSGCPYPLLDEQSNHEDRDGTDDSEDDDDTGLPLSEVLALDELGDGSFAAGDEGHVDGGHCDWFL